MSVIGMDVDDCVLDLLSEWCAWYNRHWEDTKCPTDFTDWDLKKIVRPECGDAIYDFLHLPNCYDEVKPMEGALEGIEAIRANGHRVVFVTASVGTGASQKMDWLINHGFLDTSHGHLQLDYVVCQDKSLLAGNVDLMVDDRPKNLYPFRASILFNRPHNLRSDVPFIRAVPLNAFDPLDSLAQWRMIPGTIEALLQGSRR